MAPSPYAGLNAARRRRISADDAASGSPPHTVDGPGSGTPAGDLAPPAECALLSDTDTRALVEEAATQMLAVMATGRLRRSR